ncbi:MULTISPECIES: LacI family DNA-binding transcriptional regulator [unclassified Pantoea]|uniref:LacI family DNA-binding transcriptional regulator n=1 Tax=unclassified Pantoea TaxID=2630326 RepID=UPI0023DA4293|nr:MULTISPECIES: LacI family DNA-binding transcriptional regulator [unclassified Pantoea]MDF2043216.1 substrate-binding domain-containing protein [Pantoea sp. Cr_R14]MDF2069755.1 substrate-binding domain-containing protein [Pantoea sp. Cr_R13]MDF2079220.1 substrate-binding domain-containing protein [Pantoea sp. Cr_R21]
MAKFTLKQIAAQSGLSLATLDRALHQRGNVRARTQHRIQQAIADLELMQKAGLAKGRTLFFDVIMHTPDRFQPLIREALSSQIASFAAFKIQLRFHFGANLTAQAINALLNKKALYSHGVILKAACSDELNPTIELMLKQRIPVVTMMSDLPDSARLRYIGMDNFDAGKMAAFLMSKWLRVSRSHIVAVTGSHDFIGEQERILGFQRAMQQFAPQHQVSVLAGGYGIDDRMHQSVTAFLQSHADADAVYTVGGGNPGILRAFEEQKRPVNAFIGHDLDQENCDLLQAGKIDALIEHNLQLDALHAFRTLLAFHGFIPETEPPAPYSKINIITRYNMTT